MLLPPPAMTDEMVEKIARKLLDADKAKQPPAPAITDATIEKTASWIYEAEKAKLPPPPPAMTDEMVEKIARELARRRQGRDGPPRRCAQATTTSSLLLQVFDTAKAETESSVARRW